MMRTILLKITVLAAIFAISGTHAAAQDISQMAWLGGCWESENGEPGSGEQWMPLAGGTLLGTGRTVREGYTVSFEFMQIRTTTDGQVVFIAMPSGQRTVVFPVLAINGSKAVFENPQHDFPQQVIYELEKDNRLRARIKGKRDGVNRVIEFPMKRINCDAWLSD